MQAFFAPNGGLIFYANAPSPISAQVYVGGTIHPASGLYDYEFESEIPLIESVPGAAPSRPKRSSSRSALRTRSRQDRLLLTLPNKCPKGGFPLKAEMKFESGGNGRLRVQGALPEKEKVER